METCWEREKKAKGRGKGECYIGYKGRQTDRQGVVGN